MPSAPSTVMERSHAHMQYSQFVSFAQKADAKAIASSTGASGFVITAKTTRDYVGHILRSSSSKQANDAVRTRFMDTILQMFGVTDQNDLPDEVKTAMKLEDYGQGKPLTARRILAVQKVVDAHFDSLVTPLQAKVSEMIDSFSEVRKNPDIGQKLVRTAVRACVGNQALLDFVSEHIKELVIDEFSGSDSPILCTVAAFNKKIDDFAAMFSLLQETANGNQAVMETGKKFLAGQIRMHLKPEEFKVLLASAKAVTTEHVVSLVESLADKGQNGSAKKLNDKVQELTSVLDDAAGRCKAALDKYRGVDKACGRDFLLKLILQSCGDTTLHGKVRDVLSSPVAGNLKAIYRDVAADLRNETPPKPGEGVPNLGKMPYGQRLYAADFVDRESPNLDFLKTVVDGLCGTPANASGPVKPADGNVRNGADDIEFRQYVKDVIGPAAERATESDREDFLAGAVKGDGAVADLMRFVFFRRIGRTPYKSAETTRGYFQDTLTRMLRQKIPTGCAQLMAQDEPIKKFREIAGKSHITLSMPGGGAELIDSFNYNHALDQITAFVTGGKKRSYDDIGDSDDAELGKVVVVMSLLAQDLGDLAFKGPARALNPDYDPRTDVFEESRIKPTFNIEEKTPSHPRISLEIDKDGGLQVSVSCHRDIGKLNVLRPTGETYAKIDLARSDSTMNVDFAFSINATSFGLMADAAGAERKVEISASDIAWDEFELTPDLHDPEGLKGVSIFPPPWTSLKEPGEGVRDAFDFLNPDTLTDMQEMVRHMDELERNPLMKKAEAQDKGTGVPPPASNVEVTSRTDKIRAAVKEAVKGAKELAHELKGKTFGEHKKQKGETGQQGS